MAMAPENLLRQAQDHLEDGDLESALEVLEKAAEEYPGDHDVQIVLRETREVVKKARSPRAGELDITGMQEKPSPTGFFAATSFRSADFFASRNDVLKNLLGSFEFYRDHLDQEYKTLSRQANLVFKLWVGCVLTGFSALIGGVGSIFLGYEFGGAITSASAALCLFVQRVFQKREEYYRALAEKKVRHLEYGNQWLLILQSIDALPDSETKKLRQERLIEAMTEKLRG